MFQFKRGIRNNEMMDKLAALAAKDSWWRDVLQDESLIIAVREEYLNVYWCGQSLFKVELKGGQIVASTHPKYLLNPDLNRTVPLDPESQVFKADPDHVLMRRYVPGETLGSLKKAAKIFAGEEKIGVQDIVHKHPNVVDVEIAFRDETNGGTPRIDLASFHEGKSGVELAFWEAKLFQNGELFNGSIVSQLEKYDALLARHHNDIIESYCIIAANLVRLSAMSEGRRTVAPIIKKVASEKVLSFAVPPRVRLVVFGFTAVQRDEVLKPLRSSLEARLGEKRFLAWGKAENVRLEL